MSHDTARLVRNIAIAAGISCMIVGGLLNTAHGAELSYDQRNDLATLMEAAYGQKSHNCPMQQGYVKESCEEEYDSLLQQIALLIKTIDSSQKWVLLQKIGGMFQILHQLYGPRTPDPDIFGAFLLPKQGLTGGVIRGIVSA